ncbi:C-C motif chemokine 20b [Salminus brasiliensis]|uniref:C-C motif chemokine 20b n=1 Tax=Salminus brasiliensis TaxID=930266 RepID=UPI003B82DCA7
MDKFYSGILLFILIFRAFIVETQTASCCLAYKRRPVRCALLKGYTIQTTTRHCDLKAIIFRTLHGKVFCADPNMPWTQERVKCLEKKVKKMKSSRNYIV